MLISKCVETGRQNARSNWYRLSRIWTVSQLQDMSVHLRSCDRAKVQNEVKNLSRISMGFQRQFFIAVQLLDVLQWQAARAKCKLVRLRMMSSVEHKACAYTCLLDSVCSVGWQWYADSSEQLDGHELGILHLRPLHIATRSLLLIITLSWASAMRAQMFLLRRRGKGVHPRLGSRKYAGMYTIVSNDHHIP